ncbi:hypothetical protein RI054_07g38410 [Pseudoscourfieldia marina]
MSRLFQAYVLALAMFLADRLHLALASRNTHRAPASHRSGHNPVAAPAGAFDGNALLAVSGDPASGLTGRGYARAEEKQVHTIVVPAGIASKATAANTAAHVVGTAYVVRWEARLGANAQDARLYACTTRPRKAGNAVSYTGAPCGSEDAPADPLFDREIPREVPAGAGYPLGTALGLGHLVCHVRYATLPNSHRSSDAYHGRRNQPNATYEGGDAACIVHLSTDAPRKQVALATLTNPFVYVPTRREYAFSAAFVYRGVAPAKVYRVDLAYPSGTGRGGYVEVRRRTAADPQEGLGRGKPDALTATPGGVGVGDEFTTKAVEASDDLWWKLRKSGITPAETKAHLFQAAHGAAGYDEANGVTSEKELSGAAHGYDRVRVNFTSVKFRYPKDERIVEAADKEKKRSFATYDVAPEALADPSAFLHMGNASLFTPPPAPPTAPGVYAKAEEDTDPRMTYNVMEDSALQRTSFVWVDANHPSSRPTASPDDFSPLYDGLCGWRSGQQACESADAGPECYRHAESMTSSAATPCDYTILPGDVLRAYCTYDARRAARDLSAVATPFVACELRVHLVWGAGVLEAAAARGDFKGSGNLQMQSPRFNSTTDFATGAAKPTKMDMRMQLLGAETGLMRGNESEARSLAETYAAPLFSPPLYPKVWTRVIGEKERDVSYQIMDLFERDMTGELQRSFEDLHKQSSEDIEEFRIKEDPCANEMSLSKVPQGWFGAKARSFRGKTQPLNYQKCRESLQRMTLRKAQEGWSAWLTKMYKLLDAAQTSVSRGRTPSPPPPFLQGGRKTASATRPSAPARRRPPSASAPTASVWEAMRNWGGDRARGDGMET